MTHDERRSRWDERHRGGTIESREPNAVLVGVVAGWAAGSALDVACGDGANAVWLASHGWRVTAVDWSKAALAKARARAEDAKVAVHWVDANLLDWSPRDTFDLVTILYLHLPPAERGGVYLAAAGAVAQGGRLLVVGHDRTNLTDGAGGPQDANLLFTAGELATSLTAVHPEFTIERANAVRRAVSAVRAPIDAVLLAHRGSRAP